MRIHIDDLLYGPVSLDDPLLIDLYHSKAVQRLSGIYQAGITAFINPIRRTTRLDHSLGVTALLQRLGADVVEQAAGMIHDAPHTAFSHVADFLFPNQDHTFHEANRKAVIAQSDLPEILARHGLDWQFIAEAERFSLLEQPLPALCADRLDYFLRDALVIGLASLAEVAHLLQHLQVWQGQAVMDEIRAARKLSDLFLATDDYIYTSVQEVGWYAVMAQALKAAIENNIITEADLWGTDEIVLARLRAAQNPTVTHWLNLLRPDVHFVRDDAQPDLVVLPKVRAIDPLVLAEGRVRPLSDLDSHFALRKADYVAGKQGQWGLRLETLN